MKAFFFCIVLSMAAVAASATHKVILDTDIGADLDDQVAVAYLAQESQCELLGVTTVGGGAHVRAAMVSAILKHVGRGDVPVYPGLSEGLRGARNWGGGPKVADVLVKWPHETYAPGNVAVEYLRKTIRANPGEVTLVAIGPFTNVATLFAADPEIPSLLKELVVMGGNFSGEIEWNVLCDPLAAANVYKAWKGPARFLSVGNDVTCKTYMDEPAARAFFEGKKSLGPAYDLSQNWLNAHHHGILHDPLACVALFHPEVCKVAAARVCVSTEGETAGACMRYTDWLAHVRGEAVVRPHTVATDVDVKRFYEILNRVIK